MRGASSSPPASSGVQTRGQKRRMGERDSLWDVIVNMNDDDISFTHILPKLNLTDVKFLYGVNTETRKLIKRCIRTDDLTKKFKVRQMSSVLTLGVAWEHFPWGTLDKEGLKMDGEKYFCLEVAATNKLELLKWAREEKKCEWDHNTIIMAAYQGNLEMVKYCVANECPIDTGACAHAALERSSRDDSNTYAKKSKRLGILILPPGRLLVVNFIYLNILSSVSMINITDGLVYMRQRKVT